MFIQSIGGKPLQRNVHGIIFDVDGTLVDSEPLHIEAYAKVAAQYQVTYDEDTHLRYVGTSDEVTAKGILPLIQKTAPEKTWQEIVEEKKTVYRKLIPSLRLRSGVRAFINKAKRSGVKMGVASSTDAHEVMMMLEQVKLKQEFPYIICGDQVQRKKPDPEIYLTALREMNLSPEQTLCGEDSLPGVEAASRAWMITVAFPHMYTKHLTFPQSAFVINKLSAIQVKENQINENQINESRIN